MRSIAILLLILAAVPSRAGDTASLANGMLQLTCPDDPWELNSLPDGGTAAAWNLPHKGMMILAFVGNKAPASDERATAQKKDIVDQLLAQFRRKDSDLLIHPRLEADDRFFAVVHERWKRDGITMGQWHIYRNLPPHQVVVNILGVEEDDAAAAELKKAAADLALSAQLIKSGMTAPPALAVRKTGPAIAPASPVVSPAQQALDSATLRCTTELEKKADYRAADKRVADLDARLRELRAQESPDREKIADAARERLDAKSVVESMKRAVLDKDPAVLDARKKLADAKAAK